MNEIVVIGGGVAGLCAAIELCRQGVKPILIESGNYPSHKVCGEFLSPESLSWLERLNIHPTLINEIHLDFDAKRLIFPLPKSAGSISHYTLDAALAERAQSMGAQVLTEVKVITFQHKCHSAEPHRIELSTGETLLAASVIIATGRLPSLSSPPTHFQYIGIKTHYEGISLNNGLKIFGFQGAYLGLSPIEEGKTNLACLASWRLLESAGSPEGLMQSLIHTNSHLKELLSHGKCLFDKWMTAQIPFFGFKSTPDWMDTYFIGDSMISIPPACGEGLSIAIRSGIDAALHYSSRDYKGFKKLSYKKNAFKMHMARGLHYIFMHPQLGKHGLSLCSLLPSLPEKLFLASRD